MFLTQIQKKKTTVGFNGIDSLIANICFLGAPSSILLAHLIGKEYGFFGWILTVYMGGFMFMLVRQMSAVHRKMKFHDRAYPIVWRWFRRLVHYWYNAWKEEIPEWSRGVLTAGVLIFLLTVPAMPIAILSLLLLGPSWL